jgi:hypothetical protein
MRRSCRRGTRRIPRRSAPGKRGSWRTDPPSRRLRHHRRLHRCSRTRSTRRARGVAGARTMPVRLLAALLSAVVVADQPLAAGIIVVTGLVDACLATPPADEPCATQNEHRNKKAAPHDPGSTCEPVGACDTMSQNPCVCGVRPLDVRATNGEARSLRGAATRATATRRASRTEHTHRGPGVAASDTGCSDGAPYGAGESPFPSQDIEGGGARQSHDRKPSHDQGRRSGPGA